MSFLKIISKAAPLLGSVLGGFPIGTGIGTIVKIVANSFGADPEKIDDIAEKIQKDPQSIIKLTQIENAHKVELERIKSEQEEAYQALKTSEMQTINDTMRHELMATNKFKSSWRPFFGYCVSFSWFFFMICAIIALLYSVFFAPDKSTIIIEAIAKLMGATVILWTMAFAVLGVNITKRSHDKANLINAQEKGIINKLLKKIF